MKDRLKPLFAFMLFFLGMAIIIYLFNDMDHPRLGARSGEFTYIYEGVLGLLWFLFVLFVFKPKKKD